MTEQILEGDDLETILAEDGLTLLEQYGFPAADHDFQVFARTSGDYVTYAAAPAGFFGARVEDKTEALQALRRDVLGFLVGAATDEEVVTWRGPGEFDERDMIMVCTVSDQFGSQTHYLVSRLHGHIEVDTYADRNEAADHAARTAEDHALTLDS